jgi:hypothetical protein
MTVRELLQALEGAPLDADVEMEVYDDNCQDGEGCGEYAGLSATDIGSVKYDATTNTVVIQEAS